jgi:hypothetical protein
MFLSEVGRADQAWPQAGIASPGSSVVDGMIQAHKLPVLMTPSTWARHQEDQIASLSEVAPIS